jgi:hypothetical protein
VLGVDAVAMLGERGGIAVAAAAGARVARVGVPLERAQGNEVELRALREMQHEVPVL